VPAGLPVHRKFRPTASASRGLVWQCDAERRRLQLLVGHLRQELNGIGEKRVFSETQYVMMKHTCSEWPWVLEGLELTKIKYGPETVVFLLYKEKIMFIPSKSTPSTPSA